MEDKKLQSLLNATVSHDMRNPLNAIQMQVEEQRILNQKFKEVIDALSKQSLPASRYEL